MKKERIFIAFAVFCIFLIPVSKADIAITEFMWNHDINSNCVYSELYNNGTSSVDLSSWQTQGASGLPWRNFDNIIILSKEYIIITHKLIGASSYESLCYGNNDGVWNSSDDPYRAVDGNFDINLAGSSLSIRDGPGTVINTFDYGPVYGGNGNGNSLHLLGNGSIKAGSSTPGAASGISYCGDGTCNIEENCNSCPSDCLNIGQVCCSNIAYTGNCCSSSNCTNPNVCTNNVCTAPSYCGDSICDANESCSNCSLDCALSTGQCCSSISSNADIHGRVNSTKITASGKICCSGAEYTGTCCTDAGCASPNVCSGNTCVAPSIPSCTTESCSCDLSLTLQASPTFNAGTSSNYYLYLKDSRSNFTGASIISYWITNSSLGNVSSSSFINITVNINENKTMAYSPVQRCGNETEHIRAKIVQAGCNDSSILNNEANADVSVIGESCPSQLPEESQKSGEIVYTINVPAKIEIMQDLSLDSSKIINISVNLENNKNTTKEFEVWSYVYLDKICYSCINEQEDSNKIAVSIDSGVSDTLNLENLLNISEPGIYKIKIKVLDKETSELKEFDYDFEVAGFSETITESLILENKFNETSEIKPKKVKIYSLLLFSLLLAGTAGFFAYKHKEEIISLIDEKKRIFQKKKKWRKYLEQRRGKGIFDRLSEGFIKGRENEKI